MDGDQLMTIANVKILDTYLRYLPYGANHELDQLLNHPDKIFREY
jgi:hypothetical protein